MRASIALVLFALTMAAAGLIAAAPAQARVIAVESWVEEWDEASGRWVRVEESDDETAARQNADTPITLIESRKARRLDPNFDFPLAARADDRPGAALADEAARYGPFRVIDARRAALVGSTDETSLAAFERLLRDHPRIDTLEMIEAPGTRNDLANLALGRRIRAAGLTTRVPPGGSVRSGAVELFLGGVRREIADGARFAVHSWIDRFGREADGEPANGVVERLYLDYYRAMGMDEARARAFYAMTNSVPNSSALWLEAEEMRAWLASQPAQPAQSGLRADPDPCEWTASCGG